MSDRMLRVILAVFLFIPGMAMAAIGKVVIFSPADSATVDSNYAFKLKYQAVPGPDGDHLHLNVDGKRVDIIRRLSGTTEVEPLSPGKHQVCLAINTKSHVPTGAERCISVISK